MTHDGRAAVAAAAAAEAAVVNSQEGPSLFEGGDVRVNAMHAQEPQRLGIGTAGIIYTWLSQLSR